MTISWLARFVAAVAGILVLLFAMAPEAEAQRRRAKQPTYAQIKSKFVPMVFFLAKGEPNACGPGCDTWISAEGDFDEAAEKRFRAFLDNIDNAGNRSLPIYFQSRGGLLGQAVLIGDQLYNRRMTASVGRTSRMDCRHRNRRECDRIKSAPDEVRSRLRTNALCASACVYAVIGGVRRSIAANASVRVHAPRNFGSSEAVRKEFYAIVDRFIARAGVTPDLMKLTMSVPHESMRTLTRNEIVKFGIERSEPLVSWESTEGPRRELRVRFTRKAWSGNGALESELRLQCGGNTGNRVDVSYYGLGAWDDVRDNDVRLTVDTYLAKYTIKLSPDDRRGTSASLWSATLPREAVQTLASAKTLTIEHDDRPQSLFEISKLGLDAAMAEFRQTCPTPFLRANDMAPA